MKGGNSFLETETGGKFLQGVYGLEASSAWLCSDLGVPVAFLFLQAGRELYLTGYIEQEKPKF